MRIQNIRTNPSRSEEHTSELQSPCNLVCRLLLEKKKNKSCCCFCWANFTRCFSSPPRGWRAQMGAQFLNGSLMRRGVVPMFGCSFFFFFNDTATTEIYTLSLHDALPI